MGSPCTLSSIYSSLYSRDISRSVAWSVSASGHGSSSINTPSTISPSPPPKSPATRRMPASETWFVLFVYSCPLDRIPGHQANGGPTNWPSPARRRSPRHIRGFYGMLWSCQRMETASLLCQFFSPFPKRVTLFSMPPALW